MSRCSVADVCVQLGSWDRAAELYRELAKEGTVFEQAHAHLALADLERNARGAQPAARAATAAVFSLALQEPALVPMLEEHYGRNEDWLGFALQAEEALREANTPSSLALRMSVARAYREKLSNT